MLDIAICDDMPILRDMLEMLIHEYETDNNVRFRVNQFGSGEELIEKYIKGAADFDLLFLDNYMKKTTGIQTALSIRKKYSPSCNIVFVTSSALRHEFMKAAPLAILRKPVQKECIYEVLNMVLAKKLR